MFPKFAKSSNMLTLATNKTCINLLVIRRGFLVLILLSRVAPIVRSTIIFHIFLSWPQLSIFRKIIFGLVIACKN